MKDLVKQIEKELKEEKMKNIRQYKGFEVDLEHKDYSSGAKRYIIGIAEFNADHAIDWIELTYCDSGGRFRKNSTRFGALREAVNWYKERIDRIVNEQTN